jgi:preprotein translocase subunit SecG
MLSFQKETHTPSAAVETGTSAAQPESPAQRGDDYLTVAGHGQKLKQSTLILMAVFVVGGLGIWMMIRRAVPAVAAAAPQTNEVAEIGTAIAQLNGMQSEVNNQMKSVTARLNHLSEVGQIAVEDLRKNPFTREMSSGLTNAGDATQKQFFEEQARRNAAGLQLWTITASPRGVSCMINEKLLRKGDVVEGFTIREIRAASVLVEQNGIVVELKME